MDSKVQNRSTKGDTTLQALPKACSDEKAAVEFMELQRWGDSPACPCCGSVDVYQMQDSKTGQRQVNYRWRCKDCKKQYTVRTGTVFEESRIELRHWCFGFWRASTSKKGVSALEIHRQTGLSYKSSLFMLHRIRFAMAPADSNPLTGIVEIDETYIGGKPRNPGEAREKWTSKVPVMAMIERGGRVRPKLISRGKSLLPM
jgi:transposase-like protein